MGQRGWRPRRKWSPTPPPRAFDRSVIVENRGNIWPLPLAARRSEVAGGPSVSVRVARRGRRTLRPTLWTSGRAWRLTRRPLHSVAVAPDPRGGRADPLSSFGGHEVRT